MDSNPYFVCSSLDARLYGGNCKNYGVVEQIRIFGKQGWGFDPAAIKCPTFIYQGEKDAETPVAAAEHLHSIIAGSELIVMPAIGHVTIMLKAEAIILALVQKKAIAA